MSDFIFSIPSYIVISLTAILSALFSVFALKMIRSRLDWESFKEHHDVAGFLFNALGLIYAVIVAFVIFISWVEYTDAINYSDSEVSQLRELYFSSEVFDEPMKSEVRSKIRAYTNTVITEEWKAMQDGGVSDKAKQEFHELWNLYMKAPEFKDANTKSIYDRSLDDLNDLADFRIMRLATSKKGIPPTVWTVIVIGAITSIGFSLFFGSKDFRVQAIMTALFAMTNALILLLIYYFDHPFSGDTGVPPMIYKEFLSLIDANFVR
jgi:hypothetical protein